MIEPAGPAAATPLVDDLTRVMCAIWRHHRYDSEHGYRGWHTCACGAMSDDREHRIRGWLLTNSLCVHYLAFHRDEVPTEEIEKVWALARGVDPCQCRDGVEPDAAELRGR